MNIRHRLVVFTDKFPLLGPIVWILSAQYFAIQLFVASKWVPAYQWKTNLISDLGNTVCGQYFDRYVCSPDHILMDASFVLLGITMALGSILIYHEFQRSRASLIGFGFMALSGIGTIFVGLFPENTIAAAHATGAFFGLVIGNVSLVILAFALKKVRREFRIYTFISGTFSLIAFVLFFAGINLGIGHGNMERLVSYPQTLWLILFGLYMTGSRLRRK